MKSNYKVDLTKCTSRFDKKAKIVRFIWIYVVWQLLKHIPRKMGSFARVVALRIFGAKIGEGCFIDSGVTIWIPWRLELANYVAIGREVEIYNYDWVRIKGMTVISQYCYLCTGTHDYNDPEFSLIWRPIEIGSEVWIAANTFIHPGVKINNGAVIGARSVVNKDVPAWMISAGNPAKIIKPRVIRDK